MSANLFDPDFGLLPHQRMGKVRRDAPDTSREAARLIAPRAGSKRDQVLHEIAAAWAVGGATDEAIALALHMSPSTERPRRVELVEQGWVIDAGFTRKTRAGVNATVWRLTQRGRDAL